jgi:hypothetical protein
VWEAPRTSPFTSGCWQRRRPLPASDVTFEAMTVAGRDTHSPGLGEPLTGPGEQSSNMGIVPGRADSAAYEIRVEGEIPADMRQRFASVTICRHRAETVLYRDVSDLAELDELLELLQSMSLVLSEIHRFGPDPRSARARRRRRDLTEDTRGDASPLSDDRLGVVQSYEVRVQGRLGDALLHYLRWSDRTPLAESAFRIQSNASDLWRLVASCMDHGLLIDRIVRV